jgi:hypothetical protein
MTARGGGGASIMHLRQASYNMGLERTGFLHLCDQSYHLKSEFNAKENDKPTQVYILNALYIMLNIFSSAGKNKPHKEIRNTVCSYFWDCKQDCEQ